MSNISAPTKTSQVALIDQDEVRKALTLIAEPGQTIELRMLSCKLRGDKYVHPVVSGYFNDRRDLVTALYQVERAKGIYIVLNPVNEMLLSRACNRLATGKTLTTTSDNDILKRRWLLIDLDYKRPSGISTSDQEHADALALAAEIMAEMTRRGWPEPISADSGNGAHLLYRIDEPASDAGLIQRVLQGFAQKFDWDKLNVDLTVFNQARISKLYGTLACKGDDTPDRPHRLSRILSAPNAVQVVSHAQLEAIAIAEQPKQPTPIRTGQTALNVDDWIKEHNLEDKIFQRDNKPGIWIFRECPWNAEHTDNSAFIKQLDSGAIAAGCKHNGCAGKTWEDLKALYKPVRRKVTPILKPVAKAAPETPKPKRKFLYASEVETKPVDWLWSKRIARGMLTLLVGDPGLGKSLLTAKIIAAVTTGGMLPDGTALDEPSGVIIMSPEEPNEYTLVPRLREAGADLSKVIILSEIDETDSEGKTYSRPISFPEDASILEEAIVECKASLAVIDPVLNTISAKFDSHKDQQSRAALAGVLSIAKQHKCAILGLFHLNKQQGGNVLYRSSASIAFIAMARVGLFLVPDPDNPSSGRTLVNHKNNLASKAIPLCFSIENGHDDIAHIEWTGESIYTEDQLLNQSTPTDNAKSEQETSLVELLKECNVAMTPAEIKDKLETGQSISALTMMLTRKVDQGILIRPARGMYTYNGNPFYTLKPPTTNSDVRNVINVRDVMNVRDVGTSNIANSNMLESPVGCEPASEEAGGQYNNSNITNEQQYVRNDVISPASIKKTREPMPPWYVEGTRDYRDFVARHGIKEVQKRRATWIAQQAQQSGVQA